MAAWASLSGYLFIKPGGGGLSRLKSRKKHWCVLDESRGQLLYHKCEEDARCKPPVGSIELRGAAITLDLDNQNQFVVIVDNKEVYLTAENHESMMIWLMALQSKRDQFAKLLSNSNNNNNGSETSNTTTPSATTASATTTTGAARSFRSGSAIPGGAEEQRERVGRARVGRAARPSLPHLFFSSSYRHSAQWPPGRPLLLPPPPAGEEGGEGEGQQKLLPPPPPSASSSSLSSCSSSTTTTTTTTEPVLRSAGRQRHKSTSSSDVSVVREGGHRPLTASRSLQGHNDGNSANDTTSLGDGMSPQLRRQQLSRLGETFDAGTSVSKSHLEKSDRSRSLPPVFEESHHGEPFSSFSRQLSVSMEGTELLQRHHHHHHHRPQHRPRPQTMYHNSSNAYPHPQSHPTPLPSVDHSSSGSTADSDDVIAEEALRHQEGVTSSGGGPGGGGGEGERGEAGEGTAATVDPSSMGSSLSVSTDSAIDKGDNTDLASRVQELEKELISSKCQLAKAMNRQTCFQDILKQKDEIILDLDEKLGKLGGSDMAYDSKRRASQASRELQERIRILQNQNRFLNEEVRRLARLRSQELSKIKDQNGRAAALEGDIELWKLQYVSLIQSSIRFTNTDTMDDAELSLYGGDRHKNKVRSLLEEARKVNPSLPTFENLSAGEVHVDYYGFKHQFQDCGLLLHYLCMELTQHYIYQAAAFESHQIQWNRYMKDNARDLLKNKKELKLLCRGGVPDHFRRAVWKALIHDQVGDVMMDKGPHYFRSLCSLLPDSPLAARYRKQIGLDLMRTMPSNIKFSTPGSKGIMDLQDVLLAFCVHNPNIGYCQGMNFLVAMALLFMDPQDAFWTLVAVTERYHTVSYFDQNLLGAQADQSVLRDLLVDLLPGLARHLVAIDIEIATVTLNWFLAIFFDAVPFHTLLRIWDCFLLEGPKVLFRFSLAILKMHEREIVQKTETISVMRHLKACARVTYDADGLVHLAFKGLKPFPRRQDISSKQTVYLKALKEKYRWRELQKLAFAERENLFLSLESESGSNAETFECGMVSSTGEVWVCYGSQSQCKVCVVNCSDGTMTDLEVQFTSRVMDICSVSNDAVLFGTLSWTIYCYTTSDRVQSWEQQLNDAVLSLCEYKDEASSRVFAGLADGTVAVLEDVSAKTTFYDLMYIAIGQSPVTCLRLVDSQLWCACGNTVSIIHASTLDALDSFTVSSNPYDHILSLQPGLPGVWISVRGSSILELWDPATLCCKMLYDTRAGRYPCLRKDDETYFNRARITCILPLDYSVWVGTGEGNLITYEVFMHQSSKTPSDSSSFVGSYTDSFSAAMLAEGGHELPPLGNEGYDPVREAAMRVRVWSDSCTCARGRRRTTRTPSRCPPWPCPAAARWSTTAPSPSPETPNNPALTFTPDKGHHPDPGVTGQGDTDCQGQGQGREATVSVSSGVDTLSPGVLSPGEEESEGITPVTSFCEDADHHHHHDDVVTAARGGDGEEEEEEMVGVKDGQVSRVTSTPLHTQTHDNNRSDPACCQAGTVPQQDNAARALSSEEAGSSENSETNPSSDDSQGIKPQPVATCPSDNNTQESGQAGEPGGDRKEEEEPGAGVVRPKAASPKNGMHMFYIGEGGDVKPVWTNGSVPCQAAADGDITHNPERAAAESGNTSPSSSSSYNNNNNAKEEEPSAQGTAPTSDTPAEGEEKPEEGKEEEEEGQDQQQRTSESGVEVGSSDGSVIMQLWSALTKPRKRNPSSQDSQPTSHTLSSSQEEGGGGGSVGGTGQKKPSLRTSVGSSFTSSLDSKHSDEVFQDAKDVVSLSVEDSATIVLEDFKAGGDEAEEEEEHSPASSYKSLTHLTGTTSTPSLTTTSGVESRQQQQQQQRKKRPQSLFMNRTPKPQKPSAGSVDKHDPTSRGSISSASSSSASCSKFVVGSPVTPGSQSASVASFATRASFSDAGVVDSLQPADPEAQYRLDYTNLHVDTDLESVGTSASMDSRRSSSVFGDGSVDVRVDVCDGGEEVDGRLGMLDCDPSSFIFPQDLYHPQDWGAGGVGRAMLDGGLTQMIHTPALSTLSSRTWSSYDEVSTPSVASCVESRTGRYHRGGGAGRDGGAGGGGAGGGNLPRNNSLLSATSVASTTELLYAADLTLMSKNKISDKPVKCLLLYTHESKPLVLSFSGCHNDDEAVLKWSREKDEMLWTNEPILEYNPATKTTKLPSYSYMAARISSSSSSHNL
ncbi:uncharacterized protein LOC143289420 [Babylonia areolata]|uniref:uncharacterized protein LOC143289420 n=1 Tax=Babylonia areolata TaxID=304850 RepID=UPI003FCF297F